PFVQQEGTAQSWKETPSYAVVLSTILTLLARAALDCVPMTGITAPVQGSGKSKVADSIAASVTGCSAATCPFPSEAEFGKHLPVLLHGGDRVVLIDNVEGQPLCSS